MGLTYRRRKRINRYASVNLTGRGIGLSLGPRGRKASLNSRGLLGLTLTRGGWIFRKRGKL